MPVAPPYRDGGAEVARGDAHAATRLGSATVTAAEGPAPSPLAEAPAAPTPLDERKRRIYLFAMLLALPTLPVVAVLRRGEEIGAVAKYAALGVLLIGLIAGLSRRWLTVPTAERVVLTALPGLIVARLVLAWATGGELAEVRQLVVETDGPTLLTIVLICYLAFDNRQARRWAVGICVAFTCAVLPPVVAGAAADPGAAVALLRQALTLAIVAALASFLASLKGDLAAQRARAEASEQQARTDPLTGALNRLGGEETVVAQLAQLARYEVPLTVAVLDIDRFKQRNDRFGHAAGDQALRAIVTALHDDLREADRLVRWGGDELLVVLPATRVTDALTSAQRWRQVVRDLGLSVGTAQVLTVSVGLAGAHPDDDLDALVGRADRAMYRAKDAGGDLVEVAAPRPGTLSRAR